MGKRYDFSKKAMGVILETLRQTDRVLPHPQDVPCHNSCRGLWDGQGGEQGMLSASQSCSQAGV